MPEVGVLNLTIHDNSETAGQGLNSLADALVRVKTALSGGLKLSGVATQVEKFSAAVSANSKALSASGTFLKAMSDYHKAFKDSDKVKFNTQPIETLKSVIGEGIKIGQAGTQINKIREALGGEWNTDNSAKIKTVMQDIAEGSKAIAGSNLGGTANNVSKTAKALNEYADASERVKAALGKNSAEVEKSKWLDDAARRQKEWFEGGGFATGKSMPLNLQMFASKSTDGLEKTTEKVQEFDVKLKEAFDTITSEKVNPFEDMYQSMSKLSHELGWFKKEGMRLMSGEDIERGVAKENSLTIWNGWRPEFQMKGSAYEKENTSMFDGYIDKAQAVEAALARVEQMKEAVVYGAENGSISGSQLETMNRQIEELERRIPIIGETIETKITEEFNEASSAAETFASTSDKVSKEFKGYFSDKYSFEDVYNGVREKAMGMNSLMSQWLHGQGSPEAQMYAMKIMAREYGMTLDEVKQKLASLNSIPATVNATDNLQRAYGAEMVQNIVDNYSNIDLLTMKMEGMKQSLADDINQNKADTQQIAERSMAIQQLIEKIEQLKQAQEETVKSTRSFGDVWHGLGKGMKAMFPTISSLIGRFKQIVKYRMIRSVIKHITSGFSEGLQNVYGYSKAIGGSFAPAMDSAATAINQMKNSLGAALAPAIQALIPVLNTVVNWFIQLVNYANQFFALLGGQQTWTRALPATVNAFDKQKKAAKGASAAMKDLLADWDELNIIQSQTGGSGSGSGKTAEDYLKMFEEVNRFDNKIKDIVDFVKENFNTILTTVGLIEAGMLAWRLSKGVADVLPALSKIALGFSAGATIALSVVLTDLTGQLYTDTGDPGWLIADALTGAVGATIAGGIAEKVLAGSGIYTASFTLALNGAVNLINAIEAADQQKDAEAWALGALGAVEMGLAAGLATFGLTSSAGVAIALGAVTGIGTLALTIPILLAIKRKATYRKMAYDAFANTGTNGISVSEYIKALQSRLTQITSNAQLVIDASIGFGENSEKLTENINQIYRLNSLLTSGEAFTVEESENFKTAWHNVFEAMNELSKASFNTIYAGLSEVIAEGSEELRKQAAELRKQTIEIASITGGTRGRLQKKMEMELLPTITSGTATREEVEAAIQEYDRIYKLLAQTEDSGISELNKILEKGKGFDFTGEDNPLQAAIDFISQISEQDFEPAKDKVREAFENELQSINQARSDALLAWQNGDITEAQYNQFMDVLLGDENLFRTQMKNRLEEIDKIRNQTYETVIQQAWQGYAATKEDPELARSYVDNVINPLLKAVEEAGYDVTKWRGLLKPIDYVEMVDEVVNAGEINEAKKDLYQRLYDEFNSGNDAVTVHTILEMDIDEQIKKGNIEGLNGRELIYDSDYAKEFVNSILQVEGLDYRSAIEGMASATGWSIEDVLKQVDLSKLDSDQLEELSDAIERIKEQFEFNNPVSAADISEASEKTKEVASYYEDMVERIKNALDSLNNGEYNLDNLNGENSARLTPARVTASAGFNYSDSGYGGRSNDEPIQTEPKDPQAETNTVAAGVQKGTMDVVSAIRTLVPILTQILQKENTVVVAPGSDWGKHNAKSNAAWNRMVGEEQ